MREANKKKSNIYSQKYTEQRKKKCGGEGGTQGNKKQKKQNGEEN